MLLTAIFALVMLLLAIGGLGLLIYVIVNRIRQKDQEHFEDREN